MKTTAKMVFILGLCLIQQNFAQTFTQVTTSMTNTPFAYSRPVITVLDGDNILDMLCGVGDDSYFNYYKQSAENSTSFYLMTAEFNSITTSGYSAPVIADLDGDGLLDLIIGGNNGGLLHYEQAAEFSTTFNQAPNRIQKNTGEDIDVGDKSSPAICDLDGDGLLDLLIGKDTGRIHHYEQSSVNSLTFTYITDNFNNIDYDGNFNYSSPAITDIDNDSKLDLLVGWSDGIISHYEQDAVNSATFTLIIQHFHSIDVGRSANPGFSDFDNDGYLDLMLGKQSEGIQYWESDLSTVNYSCITTATAASITENSAVLGGDVTDDNSHLVLKRGVVYSSSSTTPSLSDSKYSIGKGTGSFSATISGLSTYTTYYYRSFCFSELGIFYGPVQSFRTDGTQPTITTNDISSISNTNATSGGNITSDGGAPITARGVCYNTSPNPTISNSHTSNGTGTGSFTSSLTGLSPKTLYYVRAYSTNDVGTSYGEQKSFTTHDVPSLTTSDISAIDLTSATGGGNVSSENGSSVTARGICWSTNSNPTLSDSHTSNGTGDGEYTSSITGLTKNTKYYVRAYATNTYGTNYGTEKSFITPNQLYNMVDLDGIRNYISTTFSYPEQGTIELWFKANDVSSGFFWSLGAPGININWYCGLSGGDLISYLGSSGSSIRIEGINTNQWYHCAITWVKSLSAVTYQLYLDGNLKGTQVNGWQEPSGTLYLGGRYDDANGYYGYYDGQIEEFRMWNVVRSETEIRNNMHQFINPSSSNLILYYDFNSSSGTTVTDRTSNGYSGTLSNMTNSNWTTSTVPIGVYGSHVRSTSQTTAGQSRKTISATVTAGGDDTNYLGIFTYGDGEAPIGCETYPSGITQRTNFIWGVREFGDCTVNLSIDYSGVLGTTTNESSLKLLKRSDAAGTWTDVTSSATQNTLNHTFNLSGQTSFSEFSIGDAGANPLPVELTSFNAVYSDGKVLLTWQTATEVNNYGFNVERRVKNEEWTKVTFVQGHGNSNSPKNYSFTDNLALADNFNRLQYRLQQIDFDGKYEYSDVVDVQLETPAEFRLAQNFPNPFNPSTVISWQIAISCHVTLKVYDVLGREVVTLVDEFQPAGTYNSQLSIKNYQLSSGIYFYRMQTSSGFTATKKLMIMK